MGIIYNETLDKFKGDLSALDPNVCYMIHFRNLMYLNFIFENTTDWIEKNQANKEIQIATKKMLFWQKRNGFDQKEVNNEMEMERRKWRKN